VYTSPPVFLLPFNSLPLGWRQSKQWTITNAGEDEEEQEPSYIAGENVKWHSCLKPVWKLLRMLTVDLPYHPTIPFPGIYPRELKNMVPQRLLYKCY
jgi:hypothetical protein